jgi:hypothetical protein
MKNLFKALADFQQEVPVIHKDTDGYGYTYTNLTNILTTINPLMKKHGLGFTQLLEGDGLKTIIFHSESGEMLESIANIPSNVILKGMNAFQVLGSANTYLRRYALSSALGLISDKDIDACGDQVKLTPSEKLKECKTQSELREVFTSLTRTEQTAMETLKNQLKETLK